MKRVIGLVIVLLTTLGLAAPPAAALPAWRTTPTTWTNPAARQPLVTDLTYAEHPRFDRVVIHVRGRLPGYRVTYHRRFFYDGSGERVPIRGGLLVALRPAYGHDTDGTDVYAGPTLVRPRLPTLKAIAKIGDFEGVVTFALGLKPRRAPYRIFRLHSPQRIVIDLKHTASAVR
ncbi:hypothetical protein E8D34_06805 [Nocardioides sp. GY 10113]|uniref:AMIN-like domain-containing (lipo)protein n=1 Tax=Nocardioides sp. GY 10113 TaxID=2569761 RepID=UPI0010A81338|nr:hypothetical protein [Nocardioides sp. GY 10113]TIC87996.1 hypothetical protein E8D34_06805 [Nocardioides sp. GY 10113]